MSHTLSTTCSDCTPSRKDYVVELCPLHAAATELLAELQRAIAVNDAILGLLSKAYDRFTDNDMRPANHTLATWQQQVAHVLKKDWQVLARTTIAHAEGRR